MNVEAANDVDPKY